MLISKVITRADVFIFILSCFNNISLHCLVSTITTNSTTTSTTTSTLIRSEIIIGTAVAVVVVIVIVILVVIILLLIRKRKKKKSNINVTGHKDIEDTNLNVIEDTEYAVVKKDKPPEVPPPIPSQYSLFEDPIDPLDQKESDCTLKNPLYQKKDDAIAEYAFAHHVYDIYDVYHVYDEAKDVIDQVLQFDDTVLDITDSNIAKNYVDDIVYAVPTKLHRITQENLKEIKQLGIGQFGEVILAETVGLSLKDLRMTPLNDDKSISVQVAVKKIKENNDPKSREAFDKEVKFMSQLDHINVIRLLAVSHSSCTEHFIVMEYMENGDLNHFLLNHHFCSQHPPPSSDQLSPQILLSICVQIANGMTYLASNNYIHRDLASRNCLVGQNYVIKIGDFGLSRDLYDSAYYCTKGKAKVPIRWMSTECYYGKFSEKSDVWAYGVTVWEIYTMGREQPYAFLSNQDVVDDALKGPHRTLLSKPSYCPQEVYDIVCQHCWLSIPEERAQFDKIYSMLLKLYTS